MVVLRLGENVINRWLTSGIVGAEYDDTEYDKGVHVEDYR